MTTLQTLRKKTNTKQELVALMLNVSGSAVSKLECKPADSVSVKRLKAYAESIGAQVAITIKLPCGTEVEL